MCVKLASRLRERRLLLESPLFLELDRMNLFLDACEGGGRLERLEGVALRSSRTGVRLLFF
jgi:hypothetical protein